GTDSGDEGFVVDFALTNVTSSHSELLRPPRHGEWLLSRKSEIKSFGGDYRGRRRRNRRQRRGSADANARSSRTAQSSRGSIATTAAARAAVATAIVEFVSES